MNLLIAMLPVYIMGNLHCLGMCGPLAMCIGSSPYRGFYLMGRLLSFTLAGTIAGALGEVIVATLQVYHLSSFFSIALGLIILIVGLFIGVGGGLPFGAWLARKLAPFNDRLHHLLLIQEPWPLLLFGFLTVALPCGQTLLVYSACALSGSVYVGTLNGFFFGLLTTPSLLLAMKARKLMQAVKEWYRPVVSLSASMIGLLAILRGLADGGIISHRGFHLFMVF